MYLIDRQWNELQVGFLKVQVFETKVRVEWQDKVDQAEVVANSEYKAQLEQYQSDYENWEQQFAEITETNQIRIKTWQETQSSARKKAITWAIIAFFAWFVLGPLACIAVVVPLTLVFELFSMEIWGVVGILWVAVAVLSLEVGSAYLAVRYRFIYTKNRDASSELIPEPKKPLKPIQKLPPSFHLTSTWKEGLMPPFDRRRGHRYPTTGEEAETELALDLVRDLSEEYLGVLNLLVKPGLDVDLLLVGPRGVWILEVKHWSGTIHAMKGEWSRTQERWVNGIPYRTLESIPKFDQQWIRQKAAVERILRNKMPNQFSDNDLVRGGLIFTHPEVELDLDSSCEVEWGHLTNWLVRIRYAEIIDGFNEEARLFALDALIENAASLGEGGTKSAIELSERTYFEAVERARRYVERYIPQALAGFDRDSIDE